MLDRPTCEPPRAASSRALASFLARLFGTCRAGGATGAPRIDRPPPTAHRSRIRASSPATCELGETGPLGIHDAIIPTGEKDDSLSLLGQRQIVRDQHQVVPSSTKHGKSSSMISISVGSSRSDVGSSASSSDGIVDQRPRDRRATLLTGRAPARRGVEMVAEPYAAEQHRRLAVGVSRPLARPSIAGRATLSTSP